MVGPILVNYHTYAHLTHLLQKLKQMSHKNTSALNKHSRNPIGLFLIRQSSPQ